MKRKYSIEFNEDGSMKILNKNKEVVLTVAQLEVVHGLEDCTGDNLYEEVENWYGDVLDYLEKANLI